MHHRLLSVTALVIIVGGNFPYGFKGARSAPGADLAGWPTGRGAGGRRWAGGGRPGGSPRCCSGRALDAAADLALPGPAAPQPAHAVPAGGPGGHLAAAQLTARGGPDHDHAVAGIVARLLQLPRRAVVCAEDETHLNLLPHVRASWTLRGARPLIPTRARTGRSPCWARWS